VRRALGAALALAALAACRPSATDVAAGLRAENDRLHQRLDELVGRDPLVAAVGARKGGVHLVIQSSLLRDLVKAVARRYLDRVELDLALEQTVHEEGTLKADTFLGKMKAGEWDVTVVIHRARGVLAAGEPRLLVTPGNGLRLQLPVTIEKSDGSATVHFKWDSKGLANVVCHDFALSRDIRGRLLSNAYVLDGMVQLTAGPQSLRAEPSFPRSTFRLRVDLLPASWADVKQALAEQDTLLKCGAALDPAAVLPKLSGILSRGFDVKLPRSLFRTVDLPASVGGTGSLDGREVEVLVATEGLDVTPEALWYSASVTARPVTPPSPPAAASAPSPR
jgi:hypothetical protein